MYYTKYRSLPGHDSGNYIFSLGASLLCQIDSSIYISSLDRLLNDIDVCNNGNSHYFLS